jgi:hypothetical protein
MLSESTRYNLVLASCVLLSLGGIVWAAAADSAADAGRGGAIAVAVSFVVMFLSRGYGARALLARMSTIDSKVQLSRLAGKPEPDDQTKIANLNHDVAAIAAALRTSQRITDASLTRQNRILAISSGIGTIAWGFGDWAVPMCKKLLAFLSFVSA